MNYKKIYDDLIKKGKNRQINDDEDYEIHHIIPVSIGGALKDENNLVKLYPGEHYVAHLLLTKIYPKKSSLWYAAAMMVFTAYRYKKKYDSSIVFPIRTYKVSRRDYEKFKQKISQLTIKRFKGKIYINNGKINKIIDKKELDSFLNEGWHLGKKKLSEKTLAIIRDSNRKTAKKASTRKSHSESMIGNKNPSYGTKLMNNGKISKRIPKDQIQIFINQGWKIGENPKNKKKRKNRLLKNTKECKKDITTGWLFVHTEKEPYLIRKARPEDYDYYINTLHWQKDRGTHIYEAAENSKNEQRLLMHIDIPSYKKQKVYNELVNLYLYRGWKFGKFSEKHN